LTKSAFGDEIVSAIRGIKAGEMVISPDIFQEILKRTVRSNKTEAPEELEKLTGRELEILKLAAMGKSNKDIATELGISILTVKVHLVHIFSKLQVASRTEALITAVRLGLIDMKDFMG
jgi:DNA-binding NarL/FixJ family response regulator